MEKLQFNFETEKKNLLSKNSLLSNYSNYMINRSLMMFNYKNIPSELDSKQLEYYLQTNGNCIITKNNDKLIILVGNLSGDLNEYYNYKNYLVSNPYAKINKEYKIDSECILCKNDYSMLGLLPIINKYGVLISECEVTIKQLIILTRAMFLMSASDDNTKKSADEFIKKIYNGDFSVIGESAFFDGVKTQNTLNSNSNIINNIIELRQYLKASCFNELGLNDSFNMKRERLNTSEIQLNKDILTPYIENMLYCRKDFIKKVNEKYNTNIEVELNGAWLIKEKELENVSEELENNSETDNNSSADSENNDNSEKVV